MPLDHDLLAEVLQKTAYAPPGPQGGMPVTDPAAAAMGGGGAPPPGMPPGAPPMDPSMMGGAPPMPGAPPMDPSMMGAPPMDPSMMGAPPMDPSMMGAPPMDPAMAMEAAGVPPEGAMDPMADLLDQIRTVVREEMGKGGDEAPAEGEGEAEGDAPAEVSTDDRLNALEDMMGQLLSAAGVAPPEDASAGMPPASPEEALPEQTGQVPEAPPMDTLGAPPAVDPAAAGGLLEGQSLLGPTAMMSPAMKEASAHNDRLHKLIHQLNTYT